jgi:hypothetical protein
LFFRDGSLDYWRCDFISCTEVAEHFHDPAAEFARLGRMLRPSGWLVMMTAFLNHDTDFAAWHYQRDPTRVVSYREQTFRWLAQSHNGSCEFPRMNVALLRKLKENAGQVVFARRGRKPHWITALHLRQSLLKE